MDSSQVCLVCPVVCNEALRVCEETDFFSLLKFSVKMTKFVSTASLSSSGMFSTAAVSQKVRFRSQVYFRTLDYQITRGKYLAIDFNILN